jgi:type II secretory pathway pseudopilin PulG
MKRKQIKAFSLLEIGLVLLIMGALGLSIGPILNKQLQHQHNKVTRNKHQCIAESLAAYVLQNHCLPTASVPSQDGESVPKKYVGIVPYKTLNLDQKNGKGSKWFLVYLRR